MPGKLITFEGLDGSGKSTHLRRAAEWLASRDVPTVTTHEPGGTELGDAVRGLFLDSRWDGLDGRVELLLIAASRRQHVVELIEPGIARGDWVLCDRYVDSTHAYQGGGRGVPLAAIAAAEELAAAPTPDLTLLFDLPAAAARQRGQSPRRRDGDAVDRLDGEDLDFYERVRGAFLDRCRDDPERIRIVDSSGGKEATWRHVARLLSEFLEGAR